MAGREAGQQIGICQGPWDVLKTPVMYQINNSGLRCRLATDGNLCTALANDSILPTPCIKVASDEVDLETDIAGFYVGKIREGTIIFDGSTRRIIKSPNLDPGHEPVGPLHQGQAQRLVMLIKNIGKPLSVGDLSETTPSIEPWSVNSRIASLNKKLGRKPTEANPEGTLIKSILRQGYLFRSPPSSSN